VSEKVNNKKLLIIMATLRTNKSESKQPKVFSKTIVEENKTQILNLAVHLEKLTAQLNDGRELSIPID
jgi:hypothetical protein